MTIEEVKQAMKSMKNGKAAGEDGLLKAGVASVAE